MRRPELHMCSRAYQKGIEVHGEGLCASAPRWWTARASGSRGPMRTRQLPMGSWSPSPTTVAPCALTAPSRAAATDTATRMSVRGSRRKRTTPPYARVKYRCSGARRQPSPRSGRRHGSRPGARAPGGRQPRRWSTFGRSVRRGAVRCGRSLIGGSCQLGLCRAVS